jgi:magnesium chelatase family protein
MLARRLTTILAAITLSEALDATRIHSIAGRTGDRTALVTTWPFRAPPHILSGVGLIGGSQGLRPGEGSLAHHGVLFLDELPACRRHVLAVLRQPLEEGVTYLQSHGRPKSSCFRRVSCTAHDLSGLGQRTVAAHHDGDSHHALSVSPPHPL